MESDEFVEVFDAKFNDYKIAIEKLSEGKDKDIYATIHIDSNGRASLCTKHWLLSDARAKARELSGVGGRCTEAVNQRQYF